MDDTDNQVKRLILGWVWSKEAHKLYSGAWNISLEEGYKTEIWDPYISPEYPFNWSQVYRDPTDPTKFFQQNEKEQNQTDMITFAMIAIALYVVFKGFSVVIQLWWSLIQSSLSRALLTQCLKGVFVFVVEIDKQNMIRACWVCSVTMICVLILLFLFWAYLYTVLPWLSFQF